MIDFNFSRNPFTVTRIDAGLRSPLWNSIGGDYRHLAMVPPQIAINDENCEGEMPRQLQWAFAYVAYVQKMTFNSGYVARVNRDAIVSTCRGMNDSFRRGELDESTIYVVGSESFSALRRSGSTAICGHIDSYNVCVSAQSGGETKRYLEAHSR